MRQDESTLNSFISISMAYTAGVLLWLALTPSLSTEHEFFLNFTLYRLLLICIPLFLLILEGVVWYFSRSMKIKDLYLRFLDSKEIFITTFILSVFLFTLICMLELNIYGIKNLFLERMLPLLVLAFLLAFEIFLFQLIASKGSLWNSVWITEITAENEYIQSNGRDLRLDMLRGFFILVMIIDHIGGDSPLYLLTFGNHFFTSAAEGFFLISGLVTGLVYYKVIERKGLKAGILKALKRAGTIYLVMLSVSIIIMFLDEHFGFFPEGNVNVSQLVLQVWEILTFSRQYTNADILVVYCLMFLLLPLALILLKSKKTWILCILSAGAYLGYLIFPTRMEIPIHTFVNFYGVQLFFFGGVVMGYHHILERIQSRLDGKMLAFSGGLFLVLIVLWDMLPERAIFKAVSLSVPVSSGIEQFFDKVNVAPGRFLASLIVFGFLYILLTLKWSRCQKFLGWLLLPLGQNSLFAYTIHIGLVMGVDFIDMVISKNQLNAWMNGFFQSGGVFVVWFLIKKKWLVPSAKNRLLYYSLPVIIALAYILFGKLSLLH